MTLSDVLSHLYPHSKNIRLGFPSIGSFEFARIEIRLSSEQKKSNGPVFLMRRFFSANKKRLGAPEVTNVSDQFSSNRHLGSRTKNSARNSAQEKWTCASFLRYCAQFPLSAKTGICRSSRVQMGASESGVYSAPSDERRTSSFRMSIDWFRKSSGRVFWAAAE